MKENRNFELRSVRRPGKYTLLSTAVAVQNQHGEMGYCYVSFSDKLVEAVGKALPHGLHPSDPAFLFVVEGKDGVVYQVQAHTRSGQYKLLWSTHTRPEWLKFYRAKR